MSGSFLQKAAESLGAGEAEHLEGQPDRRLNAADYRFPKVFL
jgi:hypothetical protein